MQSSGYLAFVHEKRRHQARRRWVIRGCIVAAAAVIAAPLALLVVPVAVCYLLIVDREPA